MKGWSFGIVAGNDLRMLSSVIDSIRNEVMGAGDYEILIVGDLNKISHFAAEDTVLIDFDESIRPGWITRKKNLIAQHCKFDKISMHHDYVSLMDGWYQNFLSFDDDWDVAMTRVENFDGSRFRDWMLWQDNYGDKTIEFLRYDDQSQTNKMYVSGSYFCVKKSFMLAHPFNENLAWGQGEDVVWSKSVRSFWNYKINFNSRVKTLKMKEKWPPYDPFEAWYLSLKEKI
jgi:hypothetical protein